MQLMTSLMHTTQNPFQLSPMSFGHHVKPYAMTFKIPNNV